MQKTKSQISFQIFGIAKKEFLNALNVLKPLIPPFQNCKNGAYILIYSHDNLRCCMGVSIITF